MQNIFIELLPPWVETGLQPAFYDKESGTVLQQVSRMYPKINQIIGSVNNQNKTIADYIQKFIDLKDYVETYLNNLDVQDEINNKLDQMSQNGQLADIIAQYLQAQAVFGFDTIAEMSASESLAKGAICKVLGKTSYQAGDGGFYKIRTITSDDVVDGVNIVAITHDNTLIAELITNYTFDKLEEYVKINTAQIYNTVADMKSATNLISGSYALTLGYYALNDGGGAIYKISDTGTADEMFTIAVGTLYADLVYTNEIETLQLGIKNDNSEDISSKLNAVIGNTKISKIVFTKGSYTVNDTINIDRKIELDLNGSTITYTKENDALFDISTKYSIKPTIKNGYIIGTDTNTCFNLVRYNESTQAWGCSVNLYNLDVRRFLKVIYALNIFNCEITDCTFSTNGTYEIGVSDNSLMSNANCFKNCYFKAIDTQASYPSYSFVLSKVVNMSFISCSFEQMNNVINNTSCLAIKFYNCEFEQISGAIAKNKAGMIVNDSNHLIGISSIFEDVDYKYVPKNTYTSNFIYSNDNTVGTLRSKIRNAINKIRECSTLISTADGNNSVPDVRLQQDKWEIHKPLNILRNDSTEAGTTLTTNAYAIFAGQQNESHILTIYNVIYGSDGDRQIWRSTWMEINNENFVDLETATCIKENIWSGSALNGNTLTETLNQNKYVATTSKQYATLTTIIKYEHVGNKIK